MTNFQLSTTQQEDLIALLQRLIQFPTEDPPGREIEMAQFVYEMTQAMGMECKIDEFLPGRANVVARVKGNGSKPGLIFSAHFDTMTIGTQGNTWTHPPFGGEIHDGKVYGRGTSDMKSGMAAMIVAAQQVLQQGHSLQGDLILAFTAGESSNCIGAKRLLEKNELIVSGHSSGATGGLGTGSNAILKLVDLINNLQSFRFDVAAHPLLGEPTVSIGTINGGSAVNQTPDHAELGIDIRFLPGMEVDDMLSALRSVAGPDIEFETIDLKPSVEIVADHPLVTLTANAVKERLGDVKPPSGVAYYSDAVFLSPALNIPRVIIGPGELGFSGIVDEYVEVEKLVASAEIYQQIAYDYLT